MDNWFKVTKSGGSYFTPFSADKSTYEYAGDGSKPPTPKEACDFLNRNDSSYMEGRLYFRTSLEDQPHGESIDLPAGIYLYRPENHTDPERFVEMNVRDEGYVELADLTQEVRQDISDFLASEQDYREDNIIYKLGFLMYGPPGCGKSSLLRKILKENIPADSVVIYLYALPSVEFIQKMQATLKNRLKVFVFEELVTVVEAMPLHVVLNFLDGEHSVDKSITFATTNYPEKLPGNLVDRPSRFDKRYKIGNPKLSERRKILQFFLKTEPTEPDLTATKDLSIAAIKEIGRLVKNRKVSVSEAAKQMKAFSEMVKKEFGESRQMGINAKEFLGNDYD